VDLVTATSHDFAPSSLHPTPYALNPNRFIPRLRGATPYPRETQCGFSPNDDFFFTGVDAPMSRADKGDGALVVFRQENLPLQIRNTKLQLLNPILQNPKLQPPHSSA